MGRNASVNDSCQPLTSTFPSVTGGGTAGTAGTSGSVRENSCGVAGATVQPGGDN